MDAGLTERVGPLAPEISRDHRPGKISEWGSRNYPREVQDRAWESAPVVEGNDPALWRKDEFGAWIHRLDYGNRRSDYGWEILDHLDRSAVMERPLQWQNYTDEVAARTQDRVTAAALHDSWRLL